MYTLLVTGDVPGASTYFNPLVQQTIIPCTSGTRPTPSHDGMTCWETDTELHVTWNGSAWFYPVAPAYVAYVPTFYSNNVSGTTIGGGSVSVTYSRYQLLGKRCHYYGHATINTTTASGFGFSLPVNVSQRLFSMDTIYLKGPSAYATATGGGHVPSIAAPYNRVGPVSNSNAQLNIVASGDTVHWNLNYETV